MFDLWPLWVYAFLGIVLFACEPKGFWRTLFVSFFPLHPACCSVAGAVYDDFASLLTSILSGFPWITFVSLKDIFGKKDE